jgi:long-chain acyl-CoA synthetase
MPPNEVRISSDGEVHVKGPGLFSGYVGGSSSATTFTHDRYYRTGDIGYFDDDGFLYLTCRKDEIVKLSNGRKVSLLQIEKLYGDSIFFDRILIALDERQKLAALIEPNIPCVTDKLGTSRDSAVPRHAWNSWPKLLDLVRKELTRLGTMLPRHERLSIFCILSEPLSVTNGGLTCSLKVRRNDLFRRFISQTDQFHPVASEVSTATGVLECELRTS